MEGKIVPFYIPLGASVFNGILFSPFEFVSTRSKIQNTKYTSFSLFKHIYKTEGLKRLWTGSSWFILGNGISRGVWLCSYEYYKYNFQWSIFNSAFLAGTTTAILSNPIWYLKTQAQIPNYKGIICPSHISLTEYIKNPLFYFRSLKSYRQTFMNKKLMSGVLPATIYVSIESSIFLTSYEWFKQLCSSNNPIITGLLSGISRIMILPISYPLHVITYRKRENNNLNILNICKTIHIERAWYNGLLIYSFRMLPQSLSLFIIYETLITLYR